jgi:hypothetical protein
MRERYRVFETLTVRRGTAPSSPLPELAGGLFPYHDPVLTDGNSYYYRVEGAGPTLRVDKDDAGGHVVIHVEGPSP